MCIIKTIRALVGVVASFVFCTSFDEGLPLCFRHVGDLGNIEADENGTAVVNIKDKMLTLTGPLSIVGRSMVVRIQTV